MKRKTPLSTLFAGLAIVAAAAASLPTFAAGTSSQLDAKSSATMAAYADANILPSSSALKIETATTMVAISVGTNFIDTSAVIATRVDPQWVTIAMTRGAIDDSSVTLKTALVNSAAQGEGESGSYSAAMTQATGTGSHTSAPAIGYSPVDLAGLVKPDRIAVAVITA